MDEFAVWFNAIATGTGLFFLYYVPSLVRRIKRWVYTPLYFTVYPLESLNPKLQEYYGDNYLTPCDEDVPQIQRQLVGRAALSYAIDAGVIPILFGILLGATVVQRTMYIFLAVFVVLRIIEIRVALTKIPDYTVGGEMLSQRYFLKLARVAYGVYLILVVYFVWRSYRWSVPYFDRGDYPGLLTGFLDKSILGLLVPFVVGPVLGALMTRQLTDRPSRDAAVEKSIQ